MSEKINRRRTVEKVSAFVTKDGELGPELLVFRHPLAGIQVPAGTVEFGETPEQAVIREVAEESGIKQSKVLSMLSEMIEPLPDGQKVVRRMTKIFDSPDNDASSAGGYCLSRGNPVYVTGEAGDFSEIVCEVLDMNQDPPVSVPEVRGYVRTSILGSEVKRYLYHLASFEQTAATWSIFVDGHKFQLFWSALSSQTRLHPYQDPWLRSVYQSLISTMRS
jgi:8-oxo-dGTP pyrophosphatase MutT (NUDIX family)